MSLLFAYWSLSSFLLNGNVANCLLIFSITVPFTKIPAATIRNKYKGKSFHRHELGIHVFIQDLKENIFTINRSALSNEGNLHTLSNVPTLLSGPDC